MTEIDYREYYIQNTAGTTPDAAGSRMDRDFYRGASDEALITKFVERSAPYDAALEHAARTSNVRMIRINGDEPPDTVCTPVLNAIT